MLCWQQTFRRGKSTELWIIVKLLLCHSTKFDIILYTNNYKFYHDTYNNFRWPTPANTKKAKIEQAAKTPCPDASLADLYDKTAMPLELWKAHQPNDKAAMIAYGLWDKLDAEPAHVVWLMEMYVDYLQTV